MAKRKKPEPMAFAIWCPPGHRSAVEFSYRLFTERNEADEFAGELYDDGFPGAEVIELIPGDRYTPHAEESP